MDAYFTPAFSWSRSLVCSSPAFAAIFFLKSTRKLTSMSDSPDDLVSSSRSATGPTVLNSSKETEMHPGHRNGPNSPISFWPVVLGVTSIVVAYFLARKEQPATLSKVYALCSEQANRVYIVDHDNSQAQCVVVNGSYIADIGSLGECGIRRRIKGRLNQFHTRNDQK